MLNLKYPFNIKQTYIFIVVDSITMDKGPIQGILKFADGSRYEGQLKNYKLEGQGIYYRPDGSKKYEGEFH